MKRLAFFLFILSSSAISAQNHNHSFGRKIVFPNVEGYLTLKTDLHIHTVFSDGAVWPDIRVQEALKDGLDVISLTEHIEYQPHKNDIPHPNRNRSFDLAVKIAENSGLLIVKGSEITRRMPPGHNNTVFIDDANKLIKEDAEAVFQEAANQGGFTFWNHPAWISQKSDGMATLTQMHQKLIQNNLLHGIEVVNGQMYSDEALQIALDNDLTIIGTSDIHGLIDWDYEPEHGGHRPVTLVFAKEKTEASLREALMAGRTVAWYKNTLIGKEQNVQLLLDASLSVESMTYPSRSEVATVTIKNISDTEFMLENLSPYTLHGQADIIKIAPQETTVIKVKTLEVKESFEMSFKVLNAIIAPKTHPKITLQIK